MRGPVEQIARRGDLEQPVWNQYANYVDRLLHGNLGTSLGTRRPVLEDISRFFPATLELVLAAALLGSLLGTGIGVVTTVQRGTRLDAGGRFFAIFGLSVRDFWLAVLVQLIFFSALSILPLGGRLYIGVDPPPGVTGLYTIDSVLAGRFDLLGQALAHLVLPAVTVFGLEIGFLMSGAVLVELVFAWPGLGRYTANAIASTDYNAIMGVTIVVSSVYVLINFVVDVLYTRLDPRVRLA